MVYKKLFELMKMRGLTSYKIRQERVISERTLQNLRMGKPINTDSICQLCEALNCQPGDIMEYVHPEDTQWKIIDPQTGELEPSGFFLESGLAEQEN